GLVARFCGGRHARHGTHVSILLSPRADQLMLLHIGRERREGSSSAHRTDSHHLRHVQRQRRDDLRVTDLRKSSGSATVVSTPVREKAAEEVTAQLEAFGNGGPGTLDGWIRIPPCSEVFFRPEEVDRRSEPFDSSASLLCSFSDPQHDAGRFVPWALRRDRKL